MTHNTMLHELNNFPILVCVVSLWKFCVVITCYLRNETKKVSGEKYYCIDAKQNASHDWWINHYQQSNCSCSAIETCEPRHQQFFYFEWNIKNAVRIQKPCTHIMPLWTAEGITVFYLEHLKGNLISRVFDLFFPPPHSYPNATLSHCACHRLELGVKSTVHNVTELILFHIFCDKMYSLHHKHFK